MANNIWDTLDENPFGADVSCPAHCITINNTLIQLKCPTRDPLGCV